jgi:hypothetical protein
MGKLSLNSKLFNSIIFKPFEYKNIVFKGPSGTTMGNFISAYDIYNVDVNGVVNTGTIVVGSGAYGSETSTNLYLGRRSTSPYFNGNIALVQIYNIGLTATDVLTNYNSVKRRFGL